MSNKDGVWPWGIGRHASEDAEKVTECIDCDDACLKPLQVADYDDLCSCCREPLYQLRIAELEELVKELANFREGVRYVHQVHWAPKTPPDDELLEWVRRDHVQAAIVQRLSNDVRAFQQCDGFEVFLAPDGENGLRECRKPHWHKEDE